MQSDKPSEELVGDLSRQRQSQTKDFEIIKKLGQGAHGTVYKVRRNKDNNIYVLKQIPLDKMSPSVKKSCINEAFLLHCLQNEFIVRYYDSFLESQKLNIVMEFCEAGDLCTYINQQMGKPLQEKTIWKFLIQICLGLRFLHAQKILHRDIKTQNIFLSGKDESIRIGDLGVAKVLDKSAYAHAQVGTPYYMSPEII